MTREEREALICDQIHKITGIAVDETSVRKIVDAWEDDSDEAFQRGVWAGQETRGAQG
jgi:hypothetical protein